MDFLHININSSLQKIDKLKCIANKTKAAIIGITESKLDHTVSDLEVNLPGYGILRCDKNRNGIVKLHVIQGRIYVLMQEF